MLIPKRFAETRSRTIKVLLFILISIIFVFFRIGTADIDPDTYFHLALAREVWERGLFLQTLPQIEDNGYAIKFENVNYLFHGISSLLYGLSGFLGAELISWVFSLLILYFFYRIFSSQIGIIQSAALVAVGILFNFQFLSRLCLHRPYLVSILIFILLLSRVFSGRPWVIFLMAFVYSHFYYLILFPLAAILAPPVAQAFLSGKAFRDIHDKKYFLFALGGLSLGTIIHPYFPATIYRNIDAVLVAFVPNIAPSSLPGSEVLALEPMVVVKLALTNLTALIVVLYLIFQKPKNSQSPIVIASLSLGMVFGIGAFFSMRFFEYFVPATFIAFGFAISSLQPKTRWALLAFLVPLTIFPWWHFHDEIKSSRIRGLEMTRLSFDALSSLPSESQNRKIFNCSWGIGAYIIYARPKFRFVDAMDALPLFLLDERRYHLRHAIASAAVPDPYKELKEAFGANYIICNDSRSLTKLALNNPAFKLISAESNPIRVFVLKESPPSVFVKNLSIANLTNLPVGKYAKLSLSDFEQSTSINLTGTFLSLWQKDASAELTNCFKIRMNFDSHHIGAKKIYVRASQQYRIFRNGREIFSSPLIANLLPTPELIGLTPPLRPRDSLESIVCAKANYQLAGASFWFDTPNL